MDRSFDRVFDTWPEFPVGRMDAGEPVEREDEHVHAPGDAERESARATSNDGVAR